MGQKIFIILVIVVVCCIVLYGYFFSKKEIVKRKLKNAEHKKIANFKDGEVSKIIGDIEFVEEPLISPLSKRICSFYYVLIEEKVSTGKNSRWKTLIEEEVSSKFLIKDDANYAFINDQNIKCYIVQDERYSSGFLTDATDHLEKYLIKKGEKSEGFLGFNKTLRYKEGVLERGEKIAVFGKGQWKEAALLNLPKKYDKILEITASEGSAIYLSDDPKTTLKKTKKYNSVKRKSRHKERYSRH